MQGNIFLLGIAFYLWPEHSLSTFREICLIYTLMLKKLNMKDSNSCMSCSSVYSGDGHERADIWLNWILSFAEIRPPVPCTF